MSRSRGGSDSSSCDTIIRCSTASMPRSRLPWRSPRPPKRRETASASPTFISMSRSRSRRSSVRRYSKKSAARSCGSLVMSATPRALDQAEVERVAVAVEVVLVDDGGDDRPRQLAGFRFASRLDRWSEPADDEPLVVHLEDELHRPAAVGAHHGMTELVDGDPEVLDLVEGQAGAAAGGSGRQAREAKEVGLARDDQPDLDRMFGHWEPLVRPQGCDVPPSVTLVTKRRKASEVQVLRAPLPPHGFHRSWVGSPKPGNWVGGRPLCP